MRNGRKSAERPIIRIVTQNSFRPFPSREDNECAMDLGLREIGALANGLLSQQHGDRQPFHDLRHRWKPFFVIDSDAKDETWVY